jgi:Cof subfamily protein (haloacid dehalogenase superfamily)
MSYSFPYRLAAIDIDDTLVGVDKRVSPENAAAIQTLMQRGVHVMLASGRSHESILTFHRQLGLHGHIVSAQGALTRHAETGKVLHTAGLKPQDAITAIVAGQSLDMTIIAYANGRIYTDRLGKWADVHAAELHHSEKVHDAELTELADDVFLKVVWAAEPDRIAVAANYAEQNFRGWFDMAITCPHYLEFNAPGVNKAVGVAAVAQAMQIPQQQVLAFGDGNNDVAMLAWAGMGVAMDTGRKAAINAAKRVSPAGDPKTALARAIHQLLDEHPSLRVA